MTSVEMLCWAVLVGVLKTTYKYYKSMVITFVSNCKRQIVEGAVSRVDLATETLDNTNIQ